MGTRSSGRKIITTDDPQFPSGYRYALHYGYTDGHGTILRYDNENETPGRHERHTPDGVEEYSDIDQLMRERNLKLIEAVVEHEPDSIQAAAAAVDRDYREVHRNLQELESLGVIEFEADGQRKRPQLRGGAQHIDFSIQFPLQPTADTGASA